ncbi:MAG TPA: helix-turn-helix transcriptional regulator [Chthonomonadaceae bacterium]|nr:helix-turn-helix transcriptional regulator [Chthonomonadaceae bacterium]
MGDKINLLGSFEEIVLLAIRHLGDNAYGVPIRQAVEEATKRSTSVGALYTTLERLEEKEFISSYQGEATRERGGRAKRYFRLEGAGIQALIDADLSRRYFGLPMPNAQEGAR